MCFLEGYHSPLLVKPNKTPPPTPLAKKTRPDTRPIPVADGWAGAEMRIFPLFDSCPRTDQRMDRWTDKASYRVACPN